jgi:hypothetical protein
MVRNIAGRLGRLEWALGPSDPDAWLPPGVAWEFTPDGIRLPANRGALCDHPEVDFLDHDPRWESARGEPLRA